MVGVRGRATHPGLAVLGVVEGHWQEGAGVGACWGFLNGGMELQNSMLYCYMLHNTVFDLLHANFTQLPDEIYEAAQSIFSNAMEKVYTKKTTEIMPGFGLFYKDLQQLTKVLPVVQWNIT